MPSWAEYEERYGETRRELEDDPYHDQPCPKCGEHEFNRTSFIRGNMYGYSPEPDSEEWECSACGYVE